MGNAKKFRPFLLILIPLFLFVCMCSILVALRASDFFSSNFFPDYLWSQRIARHLEQESYIVNDVSINTIETPFKMRIMEIRVEVDINQSRAYNVISDVHRIMVEEYAHPSFQPNPLDKVIVMLDNGDVVSYGVISDFESAQKYYNEEISQDLYFKSWEYGGKIPGITPP